ncbi:phospholipid:diacylglycerol acyltransferase [Polyrhizophydium stewartii]|uniref:Phospholipid:diacylglycerol acyltransferase n=1 Tax=Polyrhizophydium stewartii TaxID=2732419 RepID=A0ABR4N515_9FUNG
MEPEHTGTASPTGADQAAGVAGHDAATAAAKHASLASPAPASGNGGPLAAASERAGGASAGEADVAEPQPQHHPVVPAGAAPASTARPATDDGADKKRPKADPAVEEDLRERTLWETVHERAHTISSSLGFRIVFSVGIALGVLTTLFLSRHQVAEHLDPLLPEHLHLQRVNDAITSALGELDMDVASLITGQGLQSFSPSYMFSQLATILPQTAFTSSAPAESTAEEFLPGSKLAREQGLHAKHPVVFIPGIVSTQLEVWNPPPRERAGTTAAAAAASEEAIQKCGQRYFRKRMWGTLNQFRALLLDKQCWIEHMKLDPVTGLDPPFVRLRAAQGLDAADYLFPGYWVWARIISNMAAIGADNNNMHLATYDWRLSFANLEKRDLYFSKLKSTIELAHKATGERVVIIAHSMGNLVFNYFLSWVQSPQGGNGGEDWPDTHLHRWVDIAGPLLGLPKTLAPMISGETRDTSQLNSYASHILEQFLSRDERAQLFRSWGGLATMFPKGGETIWGRLGETPADGHPEKHKDMSAMLTVHHVDGAGKTIDLVHYSASDAIEFAKSKAGEQAASRWDNDIDTGIATSAAQLDQARNQPSAWLNPLMTPLPKFKSGKFKIVCMYGVGIKTERKYYYLAQRSAGSANASSLDCSQPGNSNTTECLSRPAVDKEGIAHMINAAYQVPESDTEFGVQTLQGDATVPLMSLGFMCNRGWRMPRYNPSGVKVVTREFVEEHQATIMPVLRGPTSVDHVDIMGNHKVLEDLLNIVGGNDGDMQDVLRSDISDITRAVKMPEF